MEENLYPCYLNYVCTPEDTINHGEKQTCERKKV